MSRNYDLLTQMFPGRVVLGVDEIAQCLQVSRHHIYRLSSMKRLPFPLMVGLGDKIQVSLTALADYLDNPVPVEVAAPAPPSAPQPFSIKRGRPRGSKTLASKTQLAFQGQLAVATLRFEFNEVFAGLQEKLQAVAFTDDGVACAQKFDGLKSEASGLIEAASLELGQAFLNLTVPLGSSGEKKRSGL